MICSMLQFKEKTNYEIHPIKQVFTDEHEIRRRSSCYCVSKNARIDISWAPNIFFSWENDEFFELLLTYNVEFTWKFLNQSVYSKS